MRALRVLYTHVLSRASIRMDYKEADDDDDDDDDDDGENDDEDEDGNNPISTTKKDRQLPVITGPKVSSVAMSIFRSTSTRTF